MARTHDTLTRELWLLYLGGVLGAHPKFSRTDLLSIIQPLHAPGDIEEVLRAVAANSPAPLCNWLAKRGASHQQGDTVFDSIARAFRVAWSKKVLSEGREKAHFAATVSDPAEYATILRAIASEIESVSASCTKET